MVENQQYSVKLKNNYLVALILIPPIIVVALLYLSFREANYFYMLLPIFFSSFLGYIKVYNIPREIQVVGDIVKLKSIYGREILLEIKDIKMFKEKYGMLMIINGRNERIIGINGFPNITTVLEAIKNSNPKIIIEGI